MSTERNTNYWEYDLVEDAPAGCPMRLWSYCLGIIDQRQYPANFQSKMARKFADNFQWDMLARRCFNNEQSNELQLWVVRKISLDERDESDKEKPEMFHSVLSRIELYKMLAWLNGYLEAKRQPSKSHQYSPILNPFGHRASVYELRKDRRNY